MFQLRTMFITLALSLIVSQPLLAGPLLSPAGSVKLIESGVVVDKQMPAPSGMFMACDGQCFIETNGIILTGADQTIFAVIEEADEFRVMVRKGDVDFSLRADAKPVSFQTTHDSLTTKPFLLPASTDAVVRGTLRVDDSKAVLSITQGSLEVVNNDGRQLIHAGNALVMAQAVTSGETTPSAQTPAPGSGIATGAVIIGAGGATAIGAAILTTDGSSSGTEVSPF